MIILTVETVSVNALNAIGGYYGFCRETPHFTYPRLSLISLVWCTVTLFPIWIDLVFFYVSGSDETWTVLC